MSSLCMFSQPSVDCDQFSSYTLVLACVGVGNVAQLSCDLLIHNLKCDFVSSLNFKYCPSVIGLDFNGHINSESNLMTSSELYANPTLKLAVLQVRAPPFSGCKWKYVKELILFLKSVKFKTVVLLSSSFATVLKDKELSAAPLQYTVSTSFSATDRKTLEELGWHPLRIHDEQLDYELSTVSHLPGCGVANSLFEKLNKCCDTPVCLLNFFTSEGDNSGDALYVVCYLDNWLQLTAQLSGNKTSFRWTPPPSWNFLFGDDPINALY
uniref:Proteasome assembly chaperone 2 n=1 Tax=Trichobilharzia regenti TaxID=157069 RepID=A0AA85JY29_TRIRE|nr:unnamed protein product [Trichobilharzia regenti]